MLSGIMRTGARQRRLGFVELAVILVFLTILGALVGRFVLAVESEDELKLRKAREGIMLLRSALGAYSYDLGRRSPLSEEGGLSLLVAAGYLEAVPIDPWGRPYRYDNPGRFSGRGFDLYSLGPDGVVSDADDVADWSLYGSIYRGTSRIAQKRNRALDRYNGMSVE